MNRSLSTLALLVLATAPRTVRAQEMVVAPFLQSATPESVWIVWETDTVDESTVHWGGTDSLGSTVTGSVHEGNGGSRVHEVQLTGLSPATRYAYQVRTGAAQSAIHHLTTPPLSSSEASFRLVAVSDMQQSGADPDKWREVVEDGVIAYVTTHFGPDLDAEVGLVLAAGDLVDDGPDYPQWADEFFAPSSALLSEVPVYPVPGNHENNTPFFFRYFHLPDNGDTRYAEHWWSTDYSNVRVIGLDSNVGGWLEPQLAWLAAELASACEADEIDFVFAELHHPMESELWPVGENPYTGLVVAKLEQFSTDCGKPSVHFFGHTHGYSRGQSRDHAHLMVNVATAGGGIDVWGDYEQTDYPAFSVSQDEWGFVLVEVDAGADPELRLTRVSRGDQLVPGTNAVTDTLTVRRHATPPATPAPHGPWGANVPADCFALEASEYADPSGAAHTSTHWQIATTCGGFEQPAHEVWRQDSNWWFDEDLQASDDLTDEQVLRLGGEGDWCWRVRYRNESLAWSEWSAPMAFSTGPLLHTENLLGDPGAEDRADGWRSSDGTLGTTRSGGCDIAAPPDGSRIFSLGDPCGGGASGQATQEIDVTAWSTELDGGGTVVHYGGWFRGAEGTDTTSLTVVFLDGGGSELGRTAALTAASDTWTQATGESAAPTGTRALRAELVRAGTSSSASFADALSVTLGPTGTLECATDWTPPVVPTPEDEGGCGCAGVARSGPAGVLLAPMLLGLRRRYRSKK